MNEFALIDVFFKKPALARDDVIYGIGDDAACVQVKAGHELFISTDSLVDGVHFLSSWDPYDIAYRAVMVNVSDMAAMAAEPCWASLALTLPECNEAWLKRFSEGLHQALAEFHITLVGGDTTRGPLSITLTIHGQAPNGKGLRRSGAKPSDLIYVSGELGLAALAVSKLSEEGLPPKDKETMMEKLLRPKPRLDFMALLRNYASSAIDISDGLSADLMHICEASASGASLFLTEIPVHPLVRAFQKEKALDFSLSGGDDYELCFTIPKAQHPAFCEALDALNLHAYLIGTMEASKGLRGLDQQGKVLPLPAKGFEHF